VDVERQERRRYGSHSVYDLPPQTIIHWSADEWRSVSDVEARDIALGVYVADLPTGELGAGTLISFTFFWPGSRRWEGSDFAVRVIEPDRSHPY
jgi:glucoamylase